MRILDYFHLMQHVGEAVATLRDGFDQALRTRVRTTNPIERFMGELGKATDHMPIWENPHSWERHVWVLWKRLKRRNYPPTQPRP